MRAANNPDEPVEDPCLRCLPWVLTGKFTLTSRSQSARLIVNFPGRGHVHINPADHGDNETDIHSSGDTCSDHQLWDNVSPESPQSSFLAEHLLPTSLLPLRLTPDPMAHRGRLLLPASSTKVSSSQVSIFAPTVAD